MRPAPGAGRAEGAYPPALPALPVSPGHVRVALTEPDDHPTGGHLLNARTHAFPRILRVFELVRVGDVSSLRLLEHEEVEGHLADRYLEGRLAVFAEAELPAAAGALG